MASKPRSKPAKPGPRQGSGKAPAARRSAPKRSRGRPAAEDAWVLRCAPGLARLLQAELRHAKLLRHDDRADVLWQRNHDLVFVPHLQRPPGDAELRIAEELHRCLIYGRYKISDSQLARLPRALTPHGRQWRLVVTADGRHFNRFDLQRWLAKELTRRGLRIDESAPRTLFVFCVEQAYYVCLPTRDAAGTTGRDARAAEREGSLPPSIAAGMAFLGKPQDDDVILDPTCGSGTLLAEAHAYAPGAALHGIDEDPQAVKAARRNLRGAGNARIEEGDARATALSDASVSLALANLPFGKQFGDPADLTALYDAVLKELRQLATPTGWRAVLLVADAGLLEHSAQAHGLAVERKLDLRVRGEPAAMLLLRRA